MSIKKMYVIRLTREQIALIHESIMEKLIDLLMGENPEDDEKIEVLYKLDRSILNQASKGGGK